jgi:predicted aspartyl protease
MIKRVCINKIDHNKTLHTVVEIKQASIESLVDTRASMLIMATSVVRKLGIMHIVSSHETYKIASCTITHALGKIAYIPITIGKGVCQMIFLVINIDNYDVLLGLDFLMKIGAM